MKNKGFTLMELLGVIIILGIIAVVAFPPIINQIKKAKQELDNSTRIIIIEAAKDYYEDHIDDYEKTNGNTYCISINTLINNNYLNKKIKDENFNDIDTTQQVKLSYNNEKFNYDIVEGCVNNGDYVTFDYVSTGTNKEQTYEIEQSGVYKLEVWGAQGGSYDDTYHGGYGGYSVGTIYLTRGTQLYINVGEAGKIVLENQTSADGYNGGGGISTTWSDGNERRRTGGGATHIAIVSGQLKNLSAYKDTGGTNISNEILIVAGGGGGAQVNPVILSTAHSVGGSGGGFKGGTGTGTEGNPGTGGTQDAVGTAGKNGQNGLFGAGAAGSGNSSGGGGGYYGGGSALRGSGGGSGYIGNTRLSNKAMYCYDCEESPVTATKTIDTTGSNESLDSINCPSGVSSTPVSKCAKKDNGYAKITFLGES